MVKSFWNFRLKRSFVASDGNISKYVSSFWRLQRVEPYLRSLAELDNFKLTGEVEWFPVCRMKLGKHRQQIDYAKEEKRYTKVIFRYANMDNCGDNLKNCNMNGNQEGRNKRCTQWGILILLPVSGRSSCWFIQENVFWTPAVDWTSNISSVVTRLRIGPLCRAQEAIFLVNVL